MALGLWKNINIGLPNQTAQIDTGFWRWGLGLGEPLEGVTLL
jgi:hypothetical protein